MTKDEALDLALKTLRSVAGELYRVTSYCDTYDALAETNNAIMDIQQARSAPVQDSTCNETLRAQGKAYPRTCKKCGKGPCIGAPKPPPTQPAPVQEPVAHCEAGPEHCQQCHLEDRSLALAAAVRYVKNNTPKLVFDEICMALASITAAQRPVTEPHKWVGLTEKEFIEIYNRVNWDTNNSWAYELAIEAKLKEKNQ